MGSARRGNWFFTSSGISGSGVVVCLGFKWTLSVVREENLTGFLLPSDISNLSWSNKLAILSEWIDDVVIGRGRASGSFKKERRLFSWLERGTPSSSSNIGLDVVSLCSDIEIGNFGKNSGDLVVGFSSDFWVVCLSDGLRDAGWIFFLSVGLNDAGWIGLCVFGWKNEENIDEASIVSSLTDISVLSSLLIDVNSVTSILLISVVGSDVGLGVYRGENLLGGMKGRLVPLSLSLLKNAIEGLVGFGLLVDVSEFSFSGKECDGLFGRLPGRLKDKIGLLVVLSIGLGDLIAEIDGRLEGILGNNGRLVKPSGVVFGDTVFSLILSWTEI